MNSISMLDVGIIMVICILRLEQRSQSKVSNIEKCVTSLTLSHFFFFAADNNKWPAFVEFFFFGIYFFLFFFSCQIRHITTILIFLYTNFHFCLLFLFSIFFNIFFGDIAGLKFFYFGFTCRFLYSFILGFLILIGKKSILLFNFPRIFFFFKSVF